MERWYSESLALKPLKRVHRDASNPATLQDPRWQRLERRMATMLLKAVNFWNPHLSTHLYVVYCPGGVNEKQTLLRILEEPPESSSLQEATVALRRWMRWRLRAQEVGATDPDPSLLLKGLSRITKKILAENKDLMFRVSQARNHLMVDTTPTSSSVGEFATNLLAEVEQLSLSERRAMLVSKGEAPKTKKFEEPKKVEKKEDETEKEKPKCKFYLTEEGCRRGRNCKWSHDQKDDARRCWSCGSTKHFPPACPTKETSTSPPKSAKASKKEEEPGGWTKVEKKGEEEAEEGRPKADEDQMTALLEEANKMLKSINKLESGSSSQLNTCIFGRQIGRATEAAQSAEEGVRRHEDVEAHQAEVYAGRSEGFAGFRGNPSMMTSRIFRKSMWH